MKFFRWARRPSRGRSSYYNKKSVITNITDIRNLRKESGRDDALKTDVAITLKTLPFWTSGEKVKEVFGSPRRKARHMFGDLEHKVYFYRPSLGLLRTRLQIHFIDDRFFYALYTFQQSLFGENEQKVIREILAKRFSSDLPEDIGDFPDIIDPDGNEIRCQQNLEYKIEYLANFDKVENLVTHETEKIMRDRDRQKSKFIASLFS